MSAAQMPPDQTVIDVDQFLSRWAGKSDVRCAVAASVLAIIRASHAIRPLVQQGPLQRDFDVAGDHDVNGHGTTTLYDKACGLLIDALKDSPVAAVATPDRGSPVLIDEERRLLAALDPLDGSINIDTNAALGTIFSILPHHDGAQFAGAPEAFLQTGEHQLAAGFIVYGSRTSLVLTVQDGTHAFTLDPDTERFVMTGSAVKIPPLAREYAINASNYRHWDEAIRCYVDDCLKGTEGVRGTDFNMRWIGSLVAEIFRIFSRGGIYLYPADTREGYARGRLLQIFEANPIALLVEQAGGAASTGRLRIMEIVPRQLSQRVPIVVGSRLEVDYVQRLYSHPQADGERSPLFGRRGLFRV